MNKVLITNIDNRNIYLVTEDKISFYLNMPNTEVKDVSIAINLLDTTNQINLDNNNSEKIKEEITNVYNGYHYNDVVIVTPIIDSNITEQLKLNNNEQIFLYTDKYISYLINQAYSLLATEEIKVNNIIKINNNKSYSTFLTWFVKKYEGRVELVEYTKNSLNNFNTNNTTNEEMQEDISIANQVLDDTNSMDTIEDEDSLLDDEPRDPGFVSYVLLGVIVIVVSLVILYKLL